MTASVIVQYEQRAKDGLTVLPRVGTPEDMGRIIAALASGQMGISQSPKPKLAGRKGVFENRRILGLFEDRRKRLDAPDDVVLYAQIQDRGFERCSEVSTANAFLYVLIRTVSFAVSFPIRVTSRFSLKSAILTRRPILFFKDL